MGERLGTIGIDGCRAGWIAVLARQDDPDGRVRTGLRLVRQLFPAPDRTLFGRSFEQAREVVLARRAGATVNEHPIMTRRRSRSAR